MKASSSVQGVVLLRASAAIRAPETFSGQRDWLRHTCTRRTGACAHPPLTAALRGTIKQTHLRAAPALQYLYPHKKEERNSTTQRHLLGRTLMHNRAQLSIFSHSCFGLIGTIMCLCETLKLSNASMNGGKSGMFAVILQLLEYHKEENYCKSFSDYYSYLNDE